MTLCLAWIRKLKSHEELIFATDSRLRSIGDWNCIPKIIVFGRKDCAIWFQGDTAFAYPMMLQLQTAVANFPKAIDRSQDLHKFRGQILDIINDMMVYKSDYEAPETSFLFGGYSWEKNEFVLWQIHYEKTTKKFAHRTINPWRDATGEIKVFLIGDYVNEAKQRLVRLLKARKKLPGGSLNMEPFEILRDMLREERQLIGGPPQLLRVYKHMNRTPIAVRWSIKGKNVVTLLGRPLLNYEKASFPVLDPDTLKIKREDLVGK